MTGEKLDLIVDQLRQQERKEALAALEARAIA